MIHQANNRATDTGATAGKCLVTKDTVATGAMAAAASPEMNDRGVTGMRMTGEILETNDREPQLETNDREPQLEQLGGTMITDSNGGVD